MPQLVSALVVDALGTAYLTAHPDGVRHLADRALLTPNAGELAQVLEEDQDQVDGDVLGGHPARREPHRGHGAVRQRQLVRLRAVGGGLAPRCRRPGCGGGRVR